MTNNYFIFFEIEDKKSFKLQKKYNLSTFFELILVSIKKLVYLCNIPKSHYDDGVLG